MNYTQEQTQQHRDEWVKALRSGEHFQGFSRLRTEDPESDTPDYCVLGLACELSGLGEWRRTMESLQDGFFDYKEYVVEGDHSGSVLPEKVRQYYGLLTNSGHFIDKSVLEPSVAELCDTLSLAFLNDSEFSFKELADIIEKKPRGLIE